MTSTLAQIVVGRDPARAYALSSYDGRITAKLAAKMLAEALSTARDPASLARQALRQDPTAVDAVVVLGLETQARGDTAAARRLFAYAQNLTRRNFATQVWKIEDAVASGDIPSALRHYDIALRTSKEAPELLFPVLGAAIAEPEVRKNLVKVLAAKPSWAPWLLAYFAGVPGDPKPKAALFFEMRQHGQAIPTSVVSATTNHLFQSGAVEESWRFHSYFHQQVNRSKSRDPAFAAMLEAPSIYDWMPANDGSVSTSVVRGVRGGVFEFAAPASAGGVLLQQYQLLPPGTYRFGGHSIGISQPERSLPYWVLTCRDGRELGRIVVPSSTQSSGMFAGRFKVSADCPVQILSLVARPSDEIVGLSGQIDRAELAPVS